MSLKLHYEVSNGGWATLGMHHPRGNAVIDVSYLHDSLLDLAKAAIASITTEELAEVIFVEEPGHVVMEVGPVTGSELPLTVIRYEDWPEREANQAEVVLKARIQRDNFVREVAHLLEDIQQKLGEPEYSRRWKLAPFPSEVAQRLSGLIHHMNL